MKKNILLLSLAFIIICGCGNEKNNKTAEPEIINTEKEMDKQLRHVVLFKFKESATPADINKIETAFEALPSKIKEIKDLEWGLNNSPENINKGFTHCFFVTFDSEEDRAVYLPHPSHKEFVGILSPHLDDVLVIDYWNK